MKKLIYYGFLYIALITFLGGCTKNQDDTSTGGTTTTVAQDKQAITDVMRSIAQCAGNINSGGFATSFYNFFALVNGTSYADNWVQSMTDQLSAMRDFNQIGTINRFDLTYFSGHYSWNQGTSSFTYSPMNGEIIIDFPSSQSNGSNDCTFQVSQYTDGAYIINNETFFLPQSVVATLHKSNHLIMSLNFNAQYATSGFPVPLSLTTDVFLEPFHYVTTISRNTSTQFHFQTSIQDGSACETSLDASVSFANADFENFVLEEDLNNIVFTAKKGTLEVSGSWDARSYYSFTSPSVAETNSTLNVGVFSQGQRIGDLRIYDNFFSSDDLYIYYKDGSSENTSIYNDPLISDLKSILEPYFGPL